MNDIAGIRPVEIFRHLIIQLVFVANFVRLTEAQTHVPMFKAVEMQATIAPLGEMVAGNFSGRNGVAAICKVEKAVYFFEPDSLENLILTNVVSLPDTPIAISKGQEIVLDTSDHEKHFDKLAVLMSGRSAVLVSFGKDGRPVSSPSSHTDPFGSDIKAADLETEGSQDLITFGKFCLGVSVARNVGADQFQESHLIQGPLGNIPFSSIAFADFNGDLVPDIAALDWVNHKLLIFYGRGDGSFAQPVSFQLKAEPSTLTVADLTGTGYPDILIGYSRVGQIDLYGGDGFGRFFLRQTLKTEGPVSKFAIADFTGNGAMDIVALSEKQKQLTLFSYDVVTKNFKCAGSIGTGEKYDDIVPFYFTDRFRADLVASSLSERYIKVFKSSVMFNKSPDILLPVRADSRLLSVFGNDTLNYVVVADSSGKITWAQYNGANAQNLTGINQFQAEGIPYFMEPILSDPFNLVISYTNADIVSLYSLPIGPEKPRDVMTAYLPFAIDGTVDRDSATIAAGYSVQSDSDVGISYFNSTAMGSAEFFEKDYSINDHRTYLSSALSISERAFYRVWRNTPDTLTLSCTALKEKRSVSVSLRASDAKLVIYPLTSNQELPENEELYLFVEDSDTLTVFNVTLEKPMLLSLHQTCVIPLDSADFNSIKFSVSDSSLYAAVYDSLKDDVSLYLATQSQSSLVRSWHTQNKPEDIAIMPGTRKIYFLNRTESYVSIHIF